MSITLEVSRFIIRNPQHLLHYMYLQPPLLAASQCYMTQTSGTGLITDLYPIVLDISWIQTLFREWYWKTCTERYAISISLSGHL